MIGFVLIGTDDLARAGSFYDALLADVGASRMKESERSIQWGRDDGTPVLGVVKPFDGGAATGGNGTMIALKAEDQAQVTALHAKALTLGASDEGAPGPRGTGTFFGGYFRDLDGNKLVFYVT